MSKNVSNREVLEGWEEFKDAVSSKTSINLNETLAERKGRIKRLESDAEEWFNYYFPDFTYSKSATFHRAATQRILDNPEWMEVRMWSRELAKSTRTMMEVLYLCMTGKKKYVLFVSNSLDNAVRLLLPYKACLESNKRLIQDYGEQVSAANWKMSEFITINGVAFRALGAGQSPRGTRNKEVRPDVILFDDLDTDEDCRNATTIANKWHWVEEAAISVRSISKATTILFCGNRIALDCCIVRATKIADYTDEINIRDKSGKSTWIEKNSEAHIDRVLRQKSYASAQKEYFNNPLTEGAVFKNMSYKPLLPLDYYEYLVCYTDPSYTETGDYKAMTLVGKFESEFHIIKCFVQQTTNSKMIDWFYDMIEFVKGNSCYFYMEANFMQDVVINEINNAAKHRGRLIPLNRDNRKKKDKYTRIECLLEPLNRNGRLYLNEQLKDDPNMQQLVEQFINFAPGSRAHDDAPDAVEGAIWIINEKQAGRGNTGIFCIQKFENQNRY